MWAKIETTCLENLATAIEASLANVENKKNKLKVLAVKITVVTHLVRLSYEIKVIEEQIYFRLAQQNQEIARMAHGWLKYTQKESSGTL